MRFFDFFIVIVPWWTVSGYNRYLHNNELKERLSLAKLGQFNLFWDAQDPFIYISHELEPEKILFQTISHQSFLSVGYATDSQSPIVDGNYKVNEWTLFETPYQSIKKVEERDGEVVIIGELWGMVTRATYETKFKVAVGPEPQQMMLSNQLSFEINVLPVLGTFNRLFLNYWCDSKEKFYGFGSQFTHWNLKGRRVPILSAEQGIGRGAQPISFILNTFGDRAGGDWSTTYAPKGMYITNFNRSVVVENTGTYAKYVCFFLVYYLLSLYPESLYHHLIPMFTYTHLLQSPQK